jgi:hypothetical protein
LTVFNCDQVFDVLTRGPFPTGDECDAAVDAHLEQCLECRRLADALRPAVELFEAVLPDESRCLPGYRRSSPPIVGNALGGVPESSTDDLPWPSDAGAEVTRTRSPSRPIFAPAAARDDALRLAAALLLGLAMGSLLLKSPGGPAPRTPGITLAVWKTHSQAVPRDVLLSLRFAEACWKTPLTTALGLSAAGEPADNDSLLLACCTLCHSASSEAAAAQVEISHLVASCRVCHVN